MRRYHSWATLLLLTACSSAHSDGPDRDAALDAGGAAAVDGGGPRAVDGDGAATLDGGSRDGSEPVPEPPPGVTVCGGESCPDGQECCLQTLDCFDPAEPATCALPEESTEPGACVSNLDCGEREYCDPRVVPEGDGQQTALCGGVVGRCVMRPDSDQCGGSGEGVCGCDGRTYADRCEASSAGVAVARPFPCGRSSFYRQTFMCDEAHPLCDEGWTCDFERDRCVELDPFIACGTDEQCPSDSFCCDVVGACMASDCPECCFVPPEGTAYPCSSHEDCRVLQDPLAGGADEWYCQGQDGCGSLGGCKRRTANCGGELDPVCGCDGTSYANACWAAMEGVAIAHAGECP